jgi:hypothetical protein
MACLGFAERSDLAQWGDDAGRASRPAAADALEQPDVSADDLRPSRKRSSGCDSSAVGSRSNTGSV